MTGVKNEANLQAVALIREIREEARNLQRAVRDVIAALESNAPDSTQITLVGQRAENLLSANANDFETRLSDLQVLLSEHPEVRDAWGDAETRLRNLWDRVVWEWTQRGRSLPAFKAVDAELDELILECAYVTIPPRLEQNLMSLRIGGSLNFDNEFEDEIPDKTQRDKVLDWMYRHPATISGAIVKPRAVIYKAHPKKLNRLATYGAVILVAAIGFAVPYLRGPLGLSDIIVSAIPEDDKLAIAYGLGLIGLVLHGLIAGLKEIRAATSEGTEPPTLGNWLLWLHVRYLAACASVASVAAVVFLTAQVTKDTDAITMIAVGYSVDSLIDLVLPKLPSLLGKRTEVVRQALT